MSRRLLLSAIVFVMGLVSLAMWPLATVRAGDVAQQPTVAVPTVTGTPIKALITVTTEQEQINVRSGPGIQYPQVGILIAGQQVPAVGRTPGGDWIQVVYAGVPGGKAWVYSGLVNLTGGVPIVEPPPTPTPLTTPTVDPTLAAEFNFEATPTRLPTFTPPAPLVIPTFQSAGGSVVAGFPVGFLIIGLAVLGGFGFLVSLLGRR